MRRRAFLGAVGLAGFVGLAGCSALPFNSKREVTDPTEWGYDIAVEHDADDWSGLNPDWQAPTDVPDASVSAETVVEELEIPWDLSFAPNGDLFISERTGTLLRYEAGTVESVASPDDIVDASAIDAGDEGGWWSTGGEGGLMGNAVHPAYPEVPLVYAVYTYTEGDEELNKLVCYDVSDDDPPVATLIESIPGGSYHNGSRLTFGPAGYLWMTTGDAGDAALAADTESLAGKVLRLEPDGSGADSNPDIGDPRVYTYGHRNPQGITFLPDTTPVEIEHGPGAYDEVNLLHPGGNYGWGPEGERARNADTYPGTDYRRPVVNTYPGSTWAPSGGVFYTGDAVPSWENRLIVSGLRSQRLNVVTVYPSDGEPTDVGEGRRYDADWMNEAYDAVHHTALTDELGRIRHAEQGPDGALYAVTSNRDGRSEEFPVEGDDRLVRVVPK